MKKNSALATINTLEPEYVQDLPAYETRMIQRAAGVYHRGERGSRHGARRGNGRLPRAGAAADALERLEFKVQSSMFKVRKTLTKTLNLEH